MSLKLRKCTSGRGNIKGKRMQSLLAGKRRDGVVLAVLRGVSRHDLMVLV